MHNTSHVDDEPYPDLLRDKGFGGFPSLCFMDPEGNLVAQQRERTTAAFGRTLEQVRGPVLEQHKQRQDLEAKARSGDAAAAKQLFLADLATLTEAEIKAGMLRHKLDKHDLALVDQARTDLELKAILARKDGAEKIAQEVALLAKAGRRPSPNQAVAFWTQALQYAAAQKDGPFAGEMLAEVEGLAAENHAVQARLPFLRQLAEKAMAK